MGLLSHNVVIEGSIDEDGEFNGKGADQYGVQIMIHRTGPHPTPIRLAVCTCTCTYLTNPFFS